MNNKDILSIQSIRFLGVDAINQANSGHPGIVLGAAPMAHTLFTKHLTVYPKESRWINRDRFILSAGHGSALLYSLLHLSGFNVSIDDLKNFRQYPGITPGHPEYGHTDGVETTSGPLGQGIANAVGLAIAEAHLSAKFNKENFNLIDHYTFVICGDGDLQEGVALEAMSLAGHLGLGKLIVLYDSNNIQLDGATKDAITSDVKKQFEAQGWQYILVADGENLQSIHRAILAAKRDLNRPTIIEIKTIIGKGAKNEGTSKVHGSPLGKEEALSLREKTNFNYDPFFVPKEVYEHYRTKVYKRGQKAYKAWIEMLHQYELAYPEEAKNFKSYLDGFEIDLSDVTFEVGSKDATRNMLGKLLDYAGKKYPNLIGGSADLSSSTKVKGQDGLFSKENRLGRNIQFGVREHAMGAIVNGINLHGGLKAFSGGFFVFSDYMRPPMRLAAMMKLPSTFIFSHDSVLVGEDGPTHEPVEHLVGLRSIPHLNVIRPADGKEAQAALESALNSKDLAHVIVTTRQNVLNLENTSKEGVLKGGYIVSKEHQKLDGILLASGSEVELALEAKKILTQKGFDIRVVSMPSHYNFLKQDLAYQNEILPRGVKTLAIELGSSYSWYRFTQFVYGVDDFGISAPALKVLEHFGFNPHSVAVKFESILNGKEGF
ncbi:MAG TPA: transketolase [Acholeplasma sp.]|nr:transketolase [Acholeplasma sp.]